MFSDFEQVTPDSLVSVPLVSKGSHREVVLKVRASVWSGRKSVILFVGSPSARDWGTPS